MKSIRASWILTFAVLSLVSAHCASNPGATASAPATTVSVTPPPPATTPPADPSVATTPPRTPPVESSPPAPPLLAPLGSSSGVCKAFAPIKSTDPCQADADCAPASPCHATSCVAAAKAPARTPGMMCTMNLVCQSIDVGRCACVDKVCALTPR